MSDGMGSRLERLFARLDVRLGIRLMTAAILAMVLAHLLKLSAHYWAGISAILVTTGQRGGSLRASLLRLGGTCVGLGVGSLSVLLVRPPLLAAALGILVAILACQALKLGPALRLAALTTLFPWMAVAAAHGASTALFPTVLSRAENVLIGCGMALLVDALLWPQRSSRKLEARLQKDGTVLGRVARELLEAYALGRAEEGLEALEALQSERHSYAQLVADLDSETEDASLPKAGLMRRVEALQAVIDHCIALRTIQAQAGEDQVRTLLEGQLCALGEGIQAAADQRHGAGATERLHVLEDALESAYERIRGDRGTQAYPVPEVFRLLGVLYHGGQVVRSIPVLMGEVSPSGHAL